MRILWLSRHEPVPRQITELWRLFGSDAEILFDAEPFGDAQALARRIRNTGCGEVVIGAPLSVLAVLVEGGIRPLWAEMEQVAVNDPRAEVRLPGRRPRGFRFVRFRRVTGVIVTYEEIEAASPDRASGGQAMGGR